MTRWIIRAAVSAVVVALLVTFIPVGSVVDALRRTNPWVWALSLLVFLAGHAINAMKWRLLLGAPAPPVATCLRAHFAGQAANLGLPGVAGGDLVRAAYVAPSLGTARVALASVVDRLVDTGGLVVVIALALPLAGTPAALEGAVAASGRWLVGLAGAGAVLLTVLVWLRPHEATARQIDRAIQLARDRRGALVVAALLSVAVQSAFVMTNVWLARQVGVTTSVAAWFVAWPLSKLVAILPISLGGVGVREAALVTLLVPYGAPREAVLASGILWQAILAASGLIGLVITQAVRPTRDTASTRDDNRTP